MAWLRLMRVWHKVERASGGPLRRAGLTLGQFAVLAHVGAAEGMAQGDLARALAVTEGNVCQLVDRMARAGWVERRPEGRTNRLVLTPKGRALFDQVVPAHEELIAAQFAALSHDQQIQLHRLLRDLDRSLGPTAGTVTEED
jgi:DNA-binding MarR family transcriptional regulator